MRGRFGPRAADQAGARANGPIPECDAEYQE
jgi:hypothetical protein